MPKNEELVGAQHKLDHNKDGKISGDDFKGLRKKAGKKEKQETGTVNPKMDSGKSSKGNEMEQKESTIRQRLMSIWEKAGDQMEKKKHSPNQDKAEKPEDALTGQGAKDMMNQPKDVQEPLVKAVADQKKAAGQGPNGKARPNDAKVGDKKIIPSATPVKENSRLDGIMDAYKSMQKKTEVAEETVSSGIAQHGLEDHERKDHSDYMKKTHGVKTKYHGEDELSYHGTKQQVRKALDNHYGKGGDQKELHPHIYK